MPCSNAAKTRNPLKLPGVPQTPEPISAVSGPKFTILSGVEQRAPPMFGRATITLGIGPHSSSYYSSSSSSSSCLWSPYGIEQTIIFMVALCNRETIYIFMLFLLLLLLWSPYVIGRPYIFSSCFFLLSSSFFSSPNLSRRRLDVYHTSAHGVVLV